LKPAAVDLSLAADANGNSQFAPGEIKIRPLFCGEDFL